MSLDMEFAIKQDVRNNVVVRGIDRDQRRQFLRSLGLIALVVAMLVFSAVQNLRVFRGEFEFEQRREVLAVLERHHRQYQIELEVLRSPANLELRARRELGMRPAQPGEVVVLERVRPAAPPRAIVARSR